jgi:hypothetical protein
MQEQVVLRQEPGKQESVPLLVGALRDQDLFVVTKVAPLGAQFVAKPSLIGVEVIGPTVREHVKTVESSSTCLLGGTTASEYCGLELLTKA